MEDIGHSRLLKFVVSRMSDKDIESKVPGEHQIRGGVRETSDSKEIDYHYEPVITVTKEETSLTKGDLKTQKITVTEDVSDDTTTKTVSETTVITGDNGETTITTKTTTMETIIVDDSQDTDKQNVEEKKTRTKIPMLKIRKAMREIAEDRKKIEESDKEIPVIRRKSSIPRLKESKTLIQSTTDQIKERPASIVSPRAEEEFDKIFEEIVVKQNNSDSPSLIKDPEKLESKFEEIIHDYDENKIEPINIDKLRTRIPTLKRKSEHDIQVLKQIDRRRLLKKRSSIDDTNTSKIPVKETSTKTNTSSPSEPVKKAEVTSKVPIRNKIRNRHASKTKKEEELDRPRQKKSGSSSSSSSSSDESKKEISQAISEFDSVISNVESIEAEKLTDTTIERRSYQDSNGNVTTHKFEDNRVLQKSLSTENTNKDIDITISKSENITQSTTVHKSFKRTVSQQKETLTYDTLSSNVNQKSEKLTTNGETLAIDKPSTLNIYDIKTVESNLSETHEFVEPQVSFESTEEVKLINVQEISVQELESSMQDIPHNDIKPENYNDSRREEVLTDKSKPEKTFVESLDIKNRDQRIENVNVSNSTTDIKYKTNPHIQNNNTFDYEKQDYKKENCNGVTKEDTLSKDSLQKSLNGGEKDKDTSTSHSESSSDEESPPVKSSEINKSAQRQNKVSEIINNNNWSKDEKAISDKDIKTSIDIIKDKIREDKNKINEILVKSDLPEEDIIILKGKVNRVLSRLDSRDSGEVKNKQDAMDEVPKKAVLSKIALFEQKESDKSIPTRKNSKILTTPSHDAPKIVDEVLKIPIKTKEDIETIEATKVSFNIADNDNTYDIKEKEKPKRLRKLREYSSLDDEGFPDRYKIKRDGRRIEIKDELSLAEADLGDAVRGKVREMVVRMVSLERIDLEKKGLIDIKEKPRVGSVMEKIALFEQKVTTVKTSKIDLQRVQSKDITQETLPEEELKRRIEELRGARKKYGQYTDLKYIELNDGSMMPALGIGTALLDKNLTKHIIGAAIDLGYRTIDTAYIYGNEKEIGEAINEKINDGTVKREDLFIISKLWSTFHRRDLVEKACKMSLKAMGLDYFDLYLIHNPMSFKEGDNPIPRIANVLQYSDSDYLDAWYGVESVVRKGLVRRAGVSNFNSAQIDRILDKGRIKPVVNQVECHPYLTQYRLDEFCQSRNVKLSCFGVLGSKGTPLELKSGIPPVIDDPLVLTLAAGLNVTPAQLLISYQLHLNHSVITKASSGTHLWSNLQSQHVHLDAACISALNALNRNKRNFTFKGMGDTHRNYPFRIPF